MLWNVSHMHKLNLNKTKRNKQEGKLKQDLSITQLGEMAGPVQ